MNSLGETDQGGEAGVCRVGEGESAQPSVGGC